MSLPLASWTDALVRTALRTRLSRFLAVLTLVPTAVAVSAFCIGFRVGLSEAGFVYPGTAPLASCFCDLAHGMEQLPFLGLLVKAGDCAGYAMAGGPDTTR